MLKKIILIAFTLTWSFYKAQSDSVAKALVVTPIEAQPIATPPPTLGEIFKPKIALGVGMLSYHGDLYAKHFQAPWTARVAYDLNISQRLAKPLQLNFNLLFGKLGANEWLSNRQENFEAEIRSGGLSLMYDFGNFISENSRLRPWISIGVNSFEFLSKTDLYDKNGNKYFYWADGSIKNIDENATNANTAINLVRDYVYETDIRELNKDGFGKYPERAWAFPIGFGALMKITDRFDFKIGMQYYLTTTDYIDGVTNNSLATRAGTKQRDNFVYSSFSIQYDLLWTKKTNGDTLPKNYFDGVDWLALDNNDYDGDGIKDNDDRCHGTPKDVKVDEFGCPLDDDKDGVPNYVDEEQATPEGMAVNTKGVSLDDDYWQDWYTQYEDSGKIEQQIVENFYKLQQDSINNTKQTNDTNNTVYTVELARYNGPVPNEEMANLLSIGDVKSSLLPDGTTVLYTAGTYKEIQNAVKRRDEFIKEGNANAKVGSFNKDTFKTLTEEEIAALLLKQSTNSSSDSLNNEFAKGDVVYRVQLGAYKNSISKTVFKNVSDVLEVKGDDGLYHYTTKGYKTIQGAAEARATLLIEGYQDAFITAYKDSKRIPLKATKATMETTVKENIESIPSFSSVDKTLVLFKIQLGALRKIASAEFEDKIKPLQDVEKKSTTSGSMRYTAGSFNNYSKADDYRADLVSKGFADAFVIAVFKGEIISIQEAQELLK